MIIPVRCFTCGKVCSVVFGRCVLLLLLRVSSLFTPPLYTQQVIGNKWDTYLELLTSGYEEG